MKKLLIILSAVIFTVPLFAELDFDLSRLNLAEGVNEFQLDNGAKVLIKEEHSVPLAGFAVSYNVGFRSEDIDGHTGMTHLLEHMMFKGTENYGKGEFSQIMDELGARNNAFTSYDKTVYYEILPVAGLEKAMEVEADRMTGALFDPDEFEKEKTVVLSELNNYEQDPGNILERALYPQVFGDHPMTYMFGTIEDMENADRDQVYELYQTYYVPNNATITVVGDVETEAALAMVESYFGDIAANPNLPEETPIPIDFQTGVDITVEGTASEDFGTILFDLPPYDLDDPDSIALLFLDWSGMLGNFGYWAVFDWGVGFAGFSDEPEYPAEVIDEDFIRDNFEAYQSLYFNSELMSYDSISSIMFNLIYIDRDGHYSDYNTIMEKFAQLTADDIIQVIDKYLIKENSSKGFFDVTYRDPDVVADSVSMDEDHSVDIDYSYLENPTEEEIAEAQALNESIYNGTMDALSGYLSTVETITLENGLTIIYRPFEMTEQVSVALGVKNAGKAYQEVANQASFTRSLLFAGGPFRQLQIDLTLKGASMWSGVGYDYSYFYSEVNAEDFVTLVDVMGLALKDRDFIDVVLEEYKWQEWHSWELLKSDPEPIDHVPYMLNAMIMDDEGGGLDAISKKRTVLSVTMQDIQDFYQTFYRPENIIISVVGNIDKDEVFTLLEEQFGDWVQAEPVMDTNQASLAETPSHNIMETKDLNASQAIILLASPTVDYTENTNYHALFLANYILGGSGLTSRLMRTIRDEAGLTYGVYTYPYGYGDEAMFRMYMQVDPDDVDQALDLFRTELEEYRVSGPSELEILKMKTAILNQMIFEFETSTAIADTLMYYQLKRGSYDYILDFFDILQSFSYDDLMAVIEDYMPEYFYIAIAGD